MEEEKSKKMRSTEDDYNKAMTSDDPTQDSNDLEKLAKEAIKKFKSL